MWDWNLQYTSIIKKLIAISKLNQSILNFIDKITNIAVCLWLFIIAIIINFIEESITCSRILKN